MNSFDSIADCLADVQRRRVLIALIEREPPLDVDTLVGDRSDSSSPADQRIRFHHVHLPKLAAAGFIRWNEEQGTVRRGPAFDEIRPLLELLLENEAALRYDLL